MADQELCVETLEYVNTRQLRLVAASKVVRELVGLNTRQTISVAIDPGELSQSLCLVEIVGRDVCCRVVRLASDVRRRIEVDKDRDALVVVNAHEADGQAVREGFTFDL